MRNIFLGSVLFLALLQWPRFGIDTSAGVPGGTAVLPNADCQSISYTASTKTFSCNDKYVRTATIDWFDSACPVGYTEFTSTNGKTLVGTLAANNNVLGTGGSDNITPQGNIAWPAGVPTNGAISIGTFVNVASATSGNCAATNIAAGTGSTTACKAAAPNLTVTAQGHSGTLTSPTISWPAGVPTLSGTQFDNRSAFVRLIACKKD